MPDDLLPEYDYVQEIFLHLRCTACGYWWGVEGGKPDRTYHCPACGKKLAPAQYPDEPPRPRRATKEVLL